MDHPHIRVNKKPWLERFTRTGNETPLEIVARTYTQFPMQVLAVTRGNLSIFRTITNYEPHFLDLSALLLNSSPFKQAYCKNFDERFGKFLDRLGFYFHDIGGIQKFKSQSSLKNPSVEDLEKFIELIRIADTSDPLLYKDFIQKALQYMTADGLIEYAVDSECWEIVSLLIDQATEPAIKKAILEKWNKHALKNPTDLQPANINLGWGARVKAKRELRECVRKHFG